MIFRKICTFAYSHGLAHFSVCLCVCVCVVLLSRAQVHILTKIRNVKNDIYIFLYLPSNGTIANVILCDLDLIIQVQIFQIVNFSETVRASAKMRDAAFINFWFLSLNNIIVNVILCDLDLLFSGQIFQKLTSCSWWELAQNVICLL